MDGAVPAAADEHDDKRAQAERVDQWFDRAGVTICNDCTSVSRDTTTPGGNGTTTTTTDGESTFEAGGRTTYVRNTSNQSTTSRDDGFFRARHNGREYRETAAGSCRTKMTYQQVDGGVKNPGTTTTR